MSVKALLGICANIKFRIFCMLYLNKDYFVNDLKEKSFSINE